VRRMSARAQVEGRPDDTPRGHREPLADLSARTRPAIAHYGPAGIVAPRPRTGTVDSDRRGDQADRAMINQSKSPARDRRTMAGRRPHSSPRTLRCGAHDPADNHDRKIWTASPKPYRSHPGAQAPSFKDCTTFPATSAPRSIRRSCRDPFRTSGSSTTRQSSAIDVGVGLEGLTRRFRATFRWGDIKPETAPAAAVHAGSARRGVAQGRAPATTSGRTSARGAESGGGSGVSVVRELVGMHRRRVPRGAAGPNLRQAKARPALVSGMTIAIEPMINIGRARRSAPWTTSGPS